MENLVDYSEYGVLLPEILLPKNIDTKTWSVVACDQWTQDEGYWNNVKNAVGEKPSTLNIIYPEVYLSETGRKDRIKKIRENMSSYLDGDVFEREEKEFIYIERKTAYGRTRCGLVAAIDLEDYEWKPFSKALIRATEATIPSRIPPRKEIREGAKIESPHIMLLVNDSDGVLVEGTGKLAKENAPVYDGDLMLGSGHITGWGVRDQKSLSCVKNALNTLKEKGMEKDGSSFLFAVGDGNHSLATAKAVWDEYKERTGLSDSPVRYALVEIVNIYDKGLTFEPIHRVVFNAKGSSVLDYVTNVFCGNVQDVESFAQAEEIVRDSTNSFGFIYKENGTLVCKVLRTDIKELAVSRLQPVLDDYLSKNDGSIDFIHGSDELLRLGEKDNAVAILLPPIAKDAFFATISKNGPLPRKSFSMGEASEKRFYLECRRLF